MRKQGAACMAVYVTRLGRRLRRYLPFILVLVVVTYLTLVPLGTMVVASLKSHFLHDNSTWTLANYHKQLWNSAFWKMVSTSLQYSIYVAILSTVVGFALAYLSARTNIPAKPLILLMTLTPLIVPGILTTASWIQLLGYNAGPVNNLLDAVGLPRFNVLSLHGMVFLQTLHEIPLAFLMGFAACSSMDRSLEEAAAASGAPARRILRSIILPLLRPAVYGALLLVFVTTVSGFEVPLLAGAPGRIEVFTSRIYDAMARLPTDYGAVGVVGMFVLLIVVLGLLVVRKLGNVGLTGIVSGKSYKSTLIDLGKWRWFALGGVMLYSLIGTILPVAMLVWTSLLPGYRSPSLSAVGDFSLDNYHKVFSVSGLSKSIVNSLIVASVAALIVVFISLIVGYLVVRTRLKGRWLLESMATFPLAVPGVIMGVSILYWYLVFPLPFKMYGTYTILVVALVTLGLPYGLRYIAPALGQISVELEEAGAASGANLARVMVRIVLPLLRPALMTAFLFTFIVSFREISAAIFLYSFNTQVVAVTVYDLWANGQFQMVSALGVVMIVILGAAVVCIQFLSRKRKVGSAI
jgi:iron(III) transport system permease protein